MVKHLACGARGPGFNYWSRCYNFRDWLSPASSCDMAEISLKRPKSSKLPTKLTSIDFTITTERILTKLDRILSKYSTKFVVFDPSVNEVGCIINVHVTAMTFRCTILRPLGLLFKLE